MTLSKVFSPGALRHLTDAGSFERGVRYAYGRRVEKLKASDDEVTARVRGTRDYRVRLWVQEGGPGHSCTCPLGEEEVFCKHCVAVAIALADREFPEADDSVEETVGTADLRAHLLNKPKAALVDLVMEQAENDEFLKGRLLLDAAKQAGKEFDLESYQDALSRSINPAEFVDYQSMYQYSRGIEKVLDSLEGLLRAGHTADVMQLCEYALSCLDDAVGHVDDSDGYLRGIQERLCDIHLESAKQARPDVGELVERLFESGLHSELETFLDAASTYAEVLGKSGLDAYRKLADERWAQVKSLRAGDERDYGFRFRITYIMETLARVMGDVDELIQVKSRDLSHAYHYVEIVELLRDAKRFDEASGWAERGLAEFPEKTDVRLREALAHEYHRQGRHDDAMELIWKELTESPSLDSYERLHEHAVLAREWESWRPKALEFLRVEADEHSREAKQRNWTWSEGRSTLVRLFLSEGDVEAAWQEAVDGGCSESLWMAIAKKREEDHPEDALPIFQRHVEQSINRKNNQSYEEAVELMADVKNLLKRMERSEEFWAYAGSVRAKHKPKRNLMKLLDRRGW